jgi:hypothetical protein
VSSKFTLPELLEVVQDAYRCIEARTIAADIDGKIYNVVTLIQFSTSSPKQCKEDMRSRLEGNDLCKDGPLRFAWRCLPATKWPELVAELAAGKLRADRSIASLGAGLEPKSLTSHIGDDFGYIRNPTPYSMFQAKVSTFPDGMSTETGRKIECIVQNPAVLKQLRRSGFEWFIELASIYLGAINHDPGEPSLVVVVAPVPAMVNGCEFASDGHRIRVLLHPRLKGGSSLKGYVRGGSRGPLRFGELVPCKEDRGYAEADSEPISLNCDVEVRLLHSTLEIVHTLPFHVRLDGQDSNPAPNVENPVASASAPETARIEMSADSSMVRAKAVQSVLDELANITPKMKSSIDYDCVRKQFPDSMTFKVCDGHPELKLKLENVGGHAQRVRFAHEIVAANYGRKFNTVQKDWKNHKPRKEKDQESSR